MTTIQKIVNNKCSTLATIITKMRYAKVSETDTLLKKYRMELFRLRLLKEILNKFYS